MPKLTPSEAILQKNRQMIAFRKEAVDTWNLRSPFRQSLYVKARMKGASPEEAIAQSRGNLRK